MLISRETDYALRILRVLQDGQIHSVPVICESEQIPGSFGYKIVRKMARARLIQTHRGAGGGISLDIFPDTLSLWDLLQAMDDSLVVNACMSDDYECAWQQSHGRCRLHEKLCRLQKKINKDLKSIPLHQLLSR